MSALQRADPDDGGMIRRQRQVVKDRMEVMAMMNIEASVPGEGPKRLLRNSGRGDQVADPLLSRWVAFHDLHVAEKGDGVIVEDPIVLGSHERRYGRRRWLSQDGRSIPPENFEIVQQPDVVVHFLRNVLREVGR